MAFVATFNPATGSVRKMWRIQDEEVGGVVTPPEMLLLDRKEGIYGALTLHSDSTEVFKINQ